ncbi:MAG: capsule assembly Wzi family protein [Flavobacteriales bacterium]|nr:capsule assembly Wzi family protein [Flavobacteriales bacterium]
MSILQNLDRLPPGDAPESLFKRKMMSLNYISYKPVKQLEVGLFESVIWKRYDDSTGTEPSNFNALNPVPFANTAVHGLGDINANALVGLNIAVHPTRSISVYGQAMLDDINSENDKFGYQVGGVYRNILNRIDLRAEYNTVSQTAYANEDPLQGYTHFNQPLAHPFGAGFEEIYLSVKYDHKRFLADFTAVWANFDASGRNPLTSPELAVSSTAGSLEYQDVKFAYVFNPRTNMQVYAGITNRNEMRGSAEFQNQFWYFGIRTNLANTYRDF